MYEDFQKHYLKIGCSGIEGYKPKVCYTDMPFSILISSVKKGEGCDKGND